MELRVGAPKLTQLNPDREREAVALLADLLLDLARETAPAMSAGPALIVEHGEED